MLASQQDLEVALERITTYLSAPPRPGTPEDEDFQFLLGEVDQYAPSFTTPAPETHLDQLIRRASELTDEAKALLRRRAEAEEQRSFAGLPKDGRGAGPTTGV